MEAHRIAAPLYRRNTTALKQVLFCAAPCSPQRYIAAALPFWRRNNTARGGTLFTLRSLTASLFTISAAVFWQRRDDTTRRCGFILRRLHRAILRAAVFPTLCRFEIYLKFKSASMLREI